MTKAMTKVTVPADDDAHGRSVSQENMEVAVAPHRRSFRPRRPATMDEATTMVDRMSKLMFNRGTVNVSMDRPLNLGLGEDSDLPVASLTTVMTFERVVQMMKEGALGSTEGFAESSDL